MVGTPTERLNQQIHAINPEMGKKSYSISKRNLQICKLIPAEAHTQTGRGGWAGGQRAAGKQEQPSEQAQGEGRKKMVPSKQLTTQTTTMLPSQVAHEVRNRKTLKKEQRFGPPEPAMTPKNDLLRQWCGPHHCAAQGENNWREDS